MENKKNKEEFLNESLRVIYNEDFFTGLGENLLTIARRYNRKTSLLYIFIENFKEIIKSSGESIPELIGKAEEKIERKRYSLAADDEIEKLDFWETTNFLIDKKLQVSPEAHFPYPFQDMTIQQNFSSSFIDHVQQYILQQIMTNKEKKGLLFLGIQRFKK